jgi:hypothetical protein
VEAAEVEAGAAQLRAAVTGRAAAVAQLRAAVTGRAAAVARLGLAVLSGVLRPAEEAEVVEEVVVAAAIGAAGMVISRSRRRSAWGLLAE